MISFCFDFLMGFSIGIRIETSAGCPAKRDTVASAAVRGQMQGTLGWFSALCHKGGLTRGLQWAPLALKVMSLFVVLVSFFVYFPLLPPLKLFTLRPF